jgi:hypothetical protein
VSPRAHRSALGLYAACVLAASHAGAARAQDVRDVVREHLHEQLEQQPQRLAPIHEPESQQKKPKQKPRPNRTEPASGEAASFSVSFGTDSPETPQAPPGPPAPALPQRLFGKYFQLDVQLGGGYRGWLPQQFQHVAVNVGTYYVWTIDVKAKFFRFLNLHRGYYESNGLSGPRTKEAAVAAQIGSYVPKAAWVLGVLGFPITKVWEPIIRYESRAFHTEARPKRDVCVVTDAVANDLSTCQRSLDGLRVTSGFETFVAGVRYDQSKTEAAQSGKPALPPITMGIGLMSYRKPYQVNVNGNTLEGYVFDGRFRGAGLMLGTDIGGGPDRFFANIDAQLGLGRVDLTQHITLNSLAPEDWLMGYVEGNLVVGYTWPIYRGIPTLMLVPQASAGGASFFFFKTNSEPGEKNTVASANWDLLWSVHADLMLSL